MRAMEAARARKPVESRFVVACAGGEATTLEARALPMPGPGEMLLGLRVVGFCGTDLFKLKTGSARPGTVLGHELVGEVIALGDGVEKFALGDRVVVPHHVPCGTCIYCRRANETMCEVFKENLMEPGGFADAILIRPRAVEFAARKVPDGLSDESAVFMEPAACVLRGIKRSGLGAEGIAVVLGAGSMGLLHLLVLKAVFPKVDVVMVDFDVDRLALAVELGAARTATPGEETIAAVRALTAGVGADAVFDTVGGEKALSSGIELTRAGGSIVLFAHAPDGQSAAVDLNAIFKSERRIIATYSGALREQQEVFDLLVSGRLDPTPLVTHTMPLDEFQRGMDLVVARKALKVLFTPSRASGTRG
jgi:L-iditol 2-dehydrogenase